MRALRAALSSPVLGLGAAALFWSGNFVVGRGLRDAIEPLPLNFWRWVIALALLLPLGWGALAAHRGVVLREWKLIAALGVTGIAAFHTCTYFALRTTTAVNALLLLSLAPLAIVLGSWAVYRERITGAQAAAMAIALAGAVIIVVRGSLEVLLGLQLGAGDLWMLLAVLLWTVYSMLLRRRPAELPQTALLAASTAAAVLCMLPAYVVAGYGRLSLDATGIAGLLYIAVFASVLAFLLWNHGVAKVGANRAGTFIYLMPVFGAVLAFLFLGEPVEPYQFAGGALVISGVALMNRSAHRP